MSQEHSGKGAIFYKDVNIIQNQKWVKTELEQVRLQAYSHITGSRHI